MMEVVKVVKGHKITRYVGTHGMYYVNVPNKSGKGFEAFHTFRTIKAAAEFINKTM